MAKKKGPLNAQHEQAPTSAGREPEGGRRNRPPGNNRSKLEREEALVETARLDRLGYNQTDIARMLNVSPSQVCVDMRRIKEMYREATLEQRGALIQEKLLQYREIRREAYEALVRSGEDAQRRVVETVPMKKKNGESGRGKNGRNAQRKQAETVKVEEIVTKVVDTTEGRLPASEYMKIILETYEAERRLLGLDAPAKTNITGLFANLDWDKLYSQAGAEVDPVEEYLRRVAAGLEPIGPLPHPTAHPRAAHYQPRPERSLEDLTREDRDSDRSPEV